MRDPRIDPRPGDVVRPVYRVPELVAQSPPAAQAPAEWVGPSIEDDLREAEIHFAIALKRIRAAIAKHRATEGCP